MAVRDDLELDISSAISELEKVGASLDQIVSEFKVGLSDAIGILSVSQTLTVQVDASEVTTGIDEAVAGAESAVTVSVDADTSAMQDQIESVGTSEIVEITVDADTTAAQESIDDLGKQATAATGSADAGTGVAGLNGAIGGLASGGSQEAAASITGLTAGISTAIPVLGIAVGGITALTVAADKYFDSAVQVQAGQQRLNQTLGASAEELKSIDVGNLSTQLTDLNLSLGSSTTEVRNSIATFGQLGVSAGATQEDIEGTSEQVVALAARAVALNPALGSVGSVAASMSKVLARGGRFASAYGLSLTTAEINARALADTNKDNVSELTQYEKAAAGAAIATEKYGDTLEQTIAQGTENPIIQLKSLRAEIGKVISDVGKPLTAPIFEILTAAQPVIKGFVTIVGGLAAAIIPALLSIVQAIGPVVTATADGFGRVLKILGPSFVVLIGAVVKSFTPLLDLFVAILPIIEPFAIGLGFTADVLASLLDKLGPAPAIIAGVIIAFKLLSLALSTDPYILAAVALIGLVGVIKGSGDAAAEATTNQEQFRSSIFGTAKTADDTRKAIDELNASSKDYLVTKSQFAQTGQLGALEELGLSLEDIDQLINNGSEGINDFVAAGIRAGKINVTGDIFKGLNPEQVAQKIDVMNESLSHLVATGQAEITQGQSLVDAINNEAAAREAGSEAQINALLLTGQVSAAQKQEAFDRTTATGAALSYANVLTNLLAIQQEDAAAQTGLGTTLSTNAATWVALTQAVAAGTLTLEGAQAAADATGVDLQVMQGFIKDTSTEIDTFVANAVAKLPDVNKVFGDLKTESDPTTLAANLDAATLSILTFGLNLDTIKAGGFTAVADFLQNQGPEAAGAFASSFTAMTAEQKVALEQSITNNDNARKAYGDGLKNDIANSTESAKVFGENSTKGFDEGLDFEKVTQDEVNKAKTALEGEGLDDFKSIADTGGKDIGAALAFGLASGMTSNQYVIDQAARDAITHAEEAARDEADSHSPSRLFARIGQDLTSGLALGMDQNAHLVLAEARKVIDGAARATGAGSLGNPGQVVPVGSPVANGAASGGHVFQITVDATATPGVTRAEAIAQGKGIAQGIADNLPAEARIA